MWNERRADVDYVEICFLCRRYFSEGFRSRLIGYGAGYSRIYSVYLRSSIEIPTDKKRSFPSLQSICFGVLLSTICSIPAFAISITASLYKNFFNVECSSRSQN